MGMLKLQVSISASRLTIAPVGVCPMRSAGGVHFGGGNLMYGTSTLFRANRVPVSPDLAVRARTGGPLAAGGGR